MKKYWTIVVILLLLLACVSCKNRAYTLDELKDEFKEVFDDNEIIIGTWFWDEFKDIEPQYGLTVNESKLLGRWLNVSYKTNQVYNDYTFYPNELFVLDFNYANYQIIDAEKIYFYKALGTWKIVDGVVRITIYAIVTVDRALEHPNNKGQFFVDRPYAIGFIKIDDIDERGFTKRPIDDTILSKELKRKVIIKEMNKTNNLYVRNVYMNNLLNYDPGKQNKIYSYFSIVPEMAQENLSGLDVAMNPELIRKYIFGLW